MDDIECKSIHLSISLGNSLDDWELSCSSKFAKSRSKSRSHRRGGKPSEGEGSAQLVYSRATLKVPCSNPRRISVSTPATRRVLSTRKLCPRSGWKGCRISAHPKGSLCSCAVRVDRRSSE
jgi:hypothetical protein